MGRISMPQGKGSQLHNRRDYEKIGKEIPENINTKRSAQNVILVDKDIREAYKDIFGEALEEYNQRQKRADRKIPDYYEHISKSKNGEKLFYEDVLQWGTKDDFKFNFELQNRAKEVLIEYASTFEQRNPNLKLVGAYIHMDEASPHLHLDYVPVAHGYSRGLKVRNSLDKAMKEMGYVPENESRKNNATKLWKEHEREYFADLCRSRGMEVEAERKSRGSLSVAEYKEVKDKIIGKAEHELKNLQEQIADSKDDLEFWQKQTESFTEETFKKREESFQLDDENARLREKISEQAKALEDGKQKIAELDQVTEYISSDREHVQAENVVFPEKKTIFGKVEVPERKGVFVENMTSDQIQALMQRVKVSDGIEKLMTDAHKTAASIKAEATKEKNETIAKASDIVSRRNSIIQEAKNWAEKVREKYKELTGKVNELIGKKDSLEKEISHLKAYKDELEPLRKEYAELSRARDIMSGKLDYELTSARFKDWSTFPVTADYNRYRQKGELIAIYKDGTTRQVGKNQHGGWDDKTLDDQKNGLCRVGVMVEEKRVRVPESLFKELLEVRDKEKPITKQLSNLIRQQTEVDRTLTRTRVHTRER